MKKITLSHLILLALIAYTFIGCAKDTINSDKTVEISKTVPLINNKYGQHTDEIQEFLSATPLGSEIYLEEKENGEWYLKLEKTFTANKDEEKIEMIEPIYGESILI